MPRENAELVCHNTAGGASAPLTMSSRLLNLLKKLMFIMGYLFILPLSYLVPRKKNMVMFTSRFGDFEGNPKYFFLFVNSLKEKEYDLFFLTGRKDIFVELTARGYNALLYPSLKTMLKLFRVGCLIVDGNEWTHMYMYFFLAASKKVQLWHGTGIKTVGLLKRPILKMGRVRKMLAKENTFYHLVNLSSQYQAQVRGDAFRCKKILINGLPRNDILFGRDLPDVALGCDNAALERCREEKKSGRFIVTYAPTWRMLASSIKQLDLYRLERFASQNNLIFVYKFHYKQEYSLDLAHFNKLLLHEKRADVYPLLSFTDLLITDYSSIYLDFLLLDRPIIFFPYDLECYSKVERALLLEYDQVTPGPICYNQGDLEKVISRFLNEHNDSYRLQRQELRKRFFAYRDGHSSERLWEAIKLEVINGSRDSKM